jgi:signal transduction histidine kinase
VVVIQHLLTILREDWATLPEGDRLALVERTSARADGLAAFVDDAFDVARIEAHQLVTDRAPFDLGKVAAEVIDDALVTAAGRSVATSIEAGSVAMGDEVRSRQVLTNVVSNALKFSPPEAEVELAVRRDGDDLLVTITDHGPGIADDQLSLLFQPFTRLPQSLGIAGSGLGLFIARSLMEAQGGRIWVESTLGSGSTFALAFPVGPVDS